MQAEFFMGLFFREVSKLASEDDQYDSFKRNTRLEEGEQGLMYSGLHDSYIQLVHLISFLILFIRACTYIEKLKYNINQYHTMDSEHFIWKFYICNISYFLQNLFLNLTFKFLFLFLCLRQNYSAFNIIFHISIMAKRLLAEIQYIIICHYVY